MIRYKEIIISIAILLVGLRIFMYSYLTGILYFSILIILEVGSYILVNKLRERFQWLITPKDEYPQLSEEGLKKFFKHGYDPELGWIRKPNTEKKEFGKSGITKYHIDADGSRKNPGHENLPKKISFYGDSFIFSRQADDDETCQWHLSELTKTNVLNFSVGNYGIDQALLRLKREYSKNKTHVVIMGVVPSTIVRILCVWKHYNEFGNTFGFKPRFILEKGELKLIKNIIDDESKFTKYGEYIEEIRKHDYFYETKFKKEMIKFPYFVSILSNPSRNISIIPSVIKYNWIKKEKVKDYPAPMEIIMEINLKLRYKLYTKNREAVDLFIKLLEDFAAYGKKNNFTPVFLFMPQKDDLLFIRKKKSVYYSDFIEKIQNDIFTIDLIPYLLNRNDIDEVYSDDNVYGGHFSSYGNKLIAKIIYQALKGKNFI